MFSGSNSKQKKWAPEFAAGGLACRPTTRESTWSGDHQAANSGAHFFCKKALGEAPTCIKFVAMMG